MEASDVAFYLPGPVDLDALKNLDVDRDWRHFGSGLHSWVEVVQNGRFASPGRAFHIPFWPTRDGRPRGFPG